MALAASAIFAVSGAAAFGPRAQTPNGGDRRAVLRSTIAFVSTRHDLTLEIAVDVQRVLLGAEIYLNGLASLRGPLLPPTAAAAPTTFACPAVAAAPYCASRCNRSRRLIRADLVVAC